MDTRYCSHCGKKLRLGTFDVSVATTQRVYCRRCKRHVWVNDDNELDHVEKLLKWKLERKEEIRSLPKVVKIERRFCQYCRTKVEFTIESDSSYDQSYLECPKCKEITFYEDVVVEGV